uniref:Uncharacterized protein n=1 Tax=Rhizophora mucronata TaxID=61149 RepID=A0A2P2JVE2_RHIMU
MAKANGSTGTFRSYVKIAKFRHFIEARTVEYSSLVCLVQPHQLLVSKGVDDLVEKCRLGKSTVEKLGKVMKWVKDAGFALYPFRSHSSEESRQLPRNWKVLEQHEALNFFSLSEVLHLKNSCRAIFSANVGEIFLPITWRTLGDLEKEKMFISSRISKVEDNSIAEDLICIGCQLCGLPLDVENSNRRLKWLLAIFSFYICPNGFDYGVFFGFA